MPNRIIKESICYSDDIDRLSWFEEVVFYRLIVRADDYGRMDARPSYLRSTLFTTKQGVTEKNIRDDVNELASVGLVYLYEVDGRPLLLIPKWGLHQRVRDSKEKYPAPVEGTDLRLSSLVCGKSRQLAASGGLNPIQSESESISESESNPKHGAREVAFDAFWSAYPRKTAKGAARRAWDKVDITLLPLLLKAIEREKQSAQWKKDGGQYIPHPATWLNQSRWEDEGITPPDRREEAVEKPSLQDYERMKKYIEKHSGETADVDGGE